MIEVVFETHSWSADNERGIATGWLPGALSPRGETLARELGRRRREDGIEAVFCSDLRRAVQTAELALEEWSHDQPPLLLDWRLRECDYGRLNGRPAIEVHASVAGPADRFPGGESWRDAVTRVTGMLHDLPTRWDGRRVLVIGHMAVYWALEHVVRGMALDDIGRAFTWQEGWEYSSLARTDCICHWYCIILPLGRAFGGGRWIGQRSWRWWRPVRWTSTRRTLHSTLSIEATSATAPHGGARHRVRRCPRRLPSRRCHRSRRGLLARRGRPARCGRDRSVAIATAGAAAGGRASTR